MAAKKSKKKTAKQPSKPAAKTTKRTPVPPPATTKPRIEGGTPVLRQPATTRGRLLGISDKTPKQREAALNASINKINTEYGENSIVPASEANANSFLRRPSGIMQLDIDTGGGLPAASLCTIGGPDNAGKSTLLYHYHAMHQRLYGENAYIALASTEGTIDYLQARRCGWVIPVPWSVIDATNVDLEAAGLPTLTKEEVAELRREIGKNNIIEVSTMEEILKIVERSLESNLYGIVSIDSYDAMLPKGEAELNSYEDHAQRALRAGLITRFFLNYGPIKKSSKHWTTFLMTTQVRSNPAKAAAKGPMANYIKPYTGSGSAYSLKHRRDIDIVLDTGEKFKAGSRDKEEKIDKRPIIGKDVTWHLDKGKSGAHDNVRGKTPYYYDARCFDLQRTVLLAGLKYGLVREDDKGLTFYRNGVPDEYLYQIPGPDAFIQALLEEPDSEWSMRRSLCLAAKVSATYR